MAPPRVGHAMAPPGARPLSRPRGVAKQFVAGRIPGPPRQPPTNIPVAENSASAAANLVESGGPTTAV
jgi:hypothetical protein